MGDVRIRVTATPSLVSAGGVFFDLSHETWVDIEVDEEDVEDEDVIRELLDYELPGEVRVFDELVDVAWWPISVERVD